MTYNIIDIDLSHSRVNEVYNLQGSSIKVLNATSDCFIQFDDTTQDPINLRFVDEIKLKFKKFYISNVGVEDQPIFYIFNRRVEKNKSIKIIVSENFSLSDRISISDYIPEPAPTFPPFQTINITNSEPNVQIELDLSGLNFSEFNSTGSNIRIVDGNHNPIAFYLDSFNKASRTGKLYFKTPNIIINSVFIYPVGFDVPSISNGDTTFEFFDNFKIPVIDPTKWNIVDATGWSVVNGELRGSNTTGRLLSRSLFSRGIILEIKTRTVTTAPNGQTIGGFWTSATEGFTLLQHPGVNDLLRNNTTWSNLGDIIPEGNINILQQFIVQPTSINLKIKELDRNIIIYDTSHTNSVMNDPIMIGLRSDNHITGINQTYEVYWDWIRVRKVTGATAIIT